MRNLYVLSFICLLISFAAPAQQLPPVIKWQKSLGGSQNDVANSIIRTRDNGYFIVGRSNSNDGQVTGHHGSTDSADAWVVKLDQAGNILWQKSLGGSKYDVLNDVIEVSDGYICVGSTRSVDGDVTGLHIGAEDYWVVKLDKYGNILWAKCYGSNAVDRAKVIKPALDGGYIIAGDAFYDSGVANHHGSADVWIIKIDENGTMQWNNVYGDSNSQFTTDLIKTNDGGYAVAGYSVFTGTITVGPPVYSYYSTFRLKISPNGNVEWQAWGGFVQGNPGTSACYINVRQMAGPQLLFSGNTGTATVGFGFDFLLGNVNTITGLANAAYSTSNVNPEIEYGTDYSPHATAILSDSTLLYCYDTKWSNTPDATFTRLKMENNGERYIPVKQIYRKTYGNLYEADHFRGFVVLNDAEYVAAGYASPNGGDVSGNHGKLDAWIVYLVSQNEIKGRVFIDNNQNGIKDANEMYCTNALVESVKNGKKISTVTNNAGYFSNYVDTGTYSTTVKLNKLYYTMSPASKQSSFTDYNKKDSFDFAIAPMPGKKDLRIVLQQLSPVRPGFEARYKIDYSNVGTETINDVVVKLVKPSAMSHVLSVPAQTYLNADTISWNVGSLTASTVSSIVVTLQASATAISIDDVIQLYASIDPVSGDMAINDNLDTLRQIATGSYDPNDKQEVHGDTLYKHEYDAGDYLTYTIRFQNTGTDTAFNIVVRDTLSNRLDSTTLEMIGASHTYTLTIKDGKYCAWTFSNILLADSNVNEPLSHGYITYRIKPKSGLLMHDAILNSASIYFDFNEPVQTNTHQTALKPTPVTLPPQPTVSGMQTSYCKNLPAQKGKITNLPAAASGITISVDLDDEPVSVAADSSFTFNVNTLSPGQHIIQVMYINSAGSKVAALVFTVTAVLTPDVDASANITNVTNLTLPVVITAANTAGGGATPLYTFAKDRAFTNILQAEGTGSAYTIDANNLMIGNNWFYVRMKTSETCITTTTNTDSINIRRDQSTGIVDIDNPAQTINIYPNPFKSQITIGGLNVQKKYVVTVTNLQGQQLYNRKIGNRSSLELPAIQGAGGIYWLTIYDETRKRSLGSVKLMKE